VPSRRLLLWLGVIAVVVLLGNTVHYQSSVEYRAHRYFSIPWTQRITPRSVRDGVLKIVPIGTPADRVPALLERVGIGKDGLSGYYQEPRFEDTVIRLEYDPHHFAVVQSHYGIMLHFEDRTLRAIRVERWLTGL